MRYFALFLLLALVINFTAPGWIAVLFWAITVLIGLFCAANTFWNFALVVNGQPEESISADDEITRLISTAWQTATRYTAGAVATIVLIVIDVMAGLLRKLASLLGHLHCHPSQNACNTWADKLEEIGWGN